MNTSIIITSIYPPTEAVKKFADIGKNRVVVVGDKKTPAEWSCDGVFYLSVKEQESCGFMLANVMPYNHYCRKMIGYLYEIKNGADYIIDTDDDNLPKANWDFPPMDGEYECINRDKGFVNIYQFFTKQKIWARGLPLNRINETADYESAVVNTCRIGVWQGLADEDPDVDAVYRLTDNTPCYFNEREPIVLGENTISPYNSQNTMTRKELFPLLYLPTYVTFRFTDIMRGLVAQPIMWLYGYRLGFINATVVQKRNPHNYMNDFISEIPMYTHSENVVDIVSSAVSVRNSISENLLSAYEALLNKKVVDKNELTTLNAWINDIGRIKII